MASRETAAPARDEVVPHPAPPAQDGPGGRGRADAPARPALRLGAAASSPLVELALFELAFYFAYRHGMSFSQATASPFWLPDSVLLCALLSSRGRWWVIVLAPLPIRLFAEVANGIPTWFLLTTFALDSAKGLVTAAALRRFLRNPVRIGTVKEAGLYGVFAVVLVPAVSAFGGAAARSSLGYDFRSSWGQWFLGDALAHLVVTPAILYWAFAEPGPRPARSARRWIEASLLTGGLLVACWLAFERERPAGIADSLSFAPGPFLFWAAVRFGMAGASGGVAVLTFFAVTASLHGLGPFAGGSPAETARTLQEFLGVRVPALYLVAILVQQMKGVERELRQSQARFRDLANSAPVLIWEAGLDRGLSFLNQVWLDYTGTTFQESSQGTWVRCVHPDDRDRCEEIDRESFARRAAFTVECRLRRHDGAYRWVVCSAVPRLSGEGAFIGFVGSCVDISDKKEADLERQRLGAELAHVTRVATMGEIVASISHELKQPLGAILSNAEAAELLLGADPPDLEQVREILSDIRRDDQRAGDIIGRIRSLLEKRAVVRRAVDINPLVAEIVRLVSPEAAERRVAMTLEFGSGVARVSGDRVHLQQVLINLLLNGFEAMAELPEGERCLVVRTAGGEGVVRILVSDTGPGIPDDELPRLFEPFWTTKKQGLGIGLSITRSIVDAHDGRIVAVNNPGRGATFEVVLPALIGVEA